jgi:hypothetical protein
LTLFVFAVVATLDDTLSVNPYDYMIATMVSANLAVKITGALLSALPLACFRRSVCAIFSSVPSSRCLRAV